MDSLFNIIGVSSPNTGDYLAIVSILFLVFLSLLNLITGKEVKPELVELKQTDRGDKPKVIDAKEGAAPKVEVPTLSWTQRLSKGLSKSRVEVWGKIASIVGGGSVSADQLEEIEELLFTTDMSYETVDELLEELKTKLKAGSIETAEFESFIYEFLKGNMKDIQAKVNKELYSFDGNKKDTRVIMVVGVNGAGKTTTIGKLATKLKKQGANVYVGACDTFRAAAVEQLEVWCNRAGVEIVKAESGSDPSGVAYEALEKARSAGAGLLYSRYCWASSYGIEFNG